VALVAFLFCTGITKRNLHPRILRACGKNSDIIDILPLSFAMRSAARSAYGDEETRSNSMLNHVWKN